VSVVVSKSQVVLSLNTIEVFFVIWSKPWPVMVSISPPSWLRSVPG